MWTCSLCTFENHYDISECEMCETKRGQQTSQSLSSLPDSRKECSFRKFLGRWSKDDGNVVFIVTEIEGRIFVALDGCVNTVEAKMSNCEEFCFQAGSPA